MGAIAEVVCRIAVAGVLLAGYSLRAVSPEAALFRLRIEGVEAVDVEQFRLSLGCNPFLWRELRGGAGSGRVAELLFEITADGYRRNGYPHADVSVEATEDGSPWTLRVREGARYVCGAVIIDGTPAIPVEEIAGLVVAGEGAPDDRGLYPVSGTDEPLEPLWVPGSPARFTDAVLAQARKRVEACHRARGRTVPPEIAAEFVFRDDLNRALAGIQEAMARGEDFGAIARRYSDAPFAASGGKIDPQPPDRLQPVIREAWAGLAEGEIAGPLAVGNSVYYTRRIRP